MFQRRPIWLSLYKAHRLCTWVATYTSPSKAHAGSISNSPPCADRNKQGLFAQRRPNPSLTEMKKPSSQALHFSLRKILRKLGKQQGSINNATLNRKYLGYLHLIGASATNVSTFQEVLQNRMFFYLFPLFLSKLYLQIMFSEKSQPSLEVN